MREIAQDIERWIADGHTDIAVATVLKTFGSAPRKEGAKLAYLSDGRISGSISGGCVESAIIDEAAEVLRNGEQKIIHFDTTDDEAWDVGLPCGGSIDVLVEPLDLESFNFARRLLERNERIVSITELSPGGARLVAGTSGESYVTFPAGLAGPAADIAVRATRAGRFQLTEEVEIFVDIVPAVPTLVAVGGVHTAMALVRMAHVLGFKTVVVDPRQTFSRAERFPDVDILIPSWPEKAFEASPLSADTAIVVLTHDPKLDDPALDAALRSDAFYIGALGSARTQEKRRRRLGERGFSESDISRINGPVGLEIGSSTPEQIALAILAEIVAVMNGLSGGIVQKRYAEASVLPREGTKL